MVVIQFRQHFLHNGLTEKNRFGSHPESVAILSDCCHLTIIQIDDLPMATHQRLLLLLQVFRIDACIVSFLCHLPNMLESK